MKNQRKSGQNGKGGNFFVLDMPERLHYGLAVIKDFCLFGAIKDTTRKDRFLLILGLEDIAGLMEPIKFTILIQPVGQLRARHARVQRKRPARFAFDLKGRKNRPRDSITYKAPKQRSREKELASLLTPHLPPKPFTGPVGIIFTAYFEPPKGETPDKRGGLKPAIWRALAAAGKIRHVKKPDADNVIKHFKDVANKRFWTDDAVVSDEVVRKRLGSPQRIEVEITPLPLVVDEGGLL